MKEKPKTIQRQIKFRKELWDMVEEIQEAFGYTTHAAVFHQGIVQLHRSLFPAYMDRRKLKIETMKSMGERAENSDVKMKKLICNDLGGTIKTLADGSKVCKYWTYSHKKRYQQEVEFGALTKDLINVQYYPSREKVEKLQAEGKTEYE